MRTFQTLQNGRVKIVHGRFGGDTSRDETRHRRGDNSYRHLRMQQHLRFVTEEAVAELDGLMGYNGTIKPAAKRTRPGDKPVAGAVAADTVVGLIVVVPPRAAPRFKAYIREDGKICAAALN